MKKNLVKLPFKNIFFFQNLKTGFRIPNPPLFSTVHYIYHGLERENNEYEKQQYVFGSI